jgi:hypothetical protein
MLLAAYKKISSPLLSAQSKARIADEASDYLTSALPMSRGSAAAVTLPLL